MTLTPEDVHKKTFTPVRLREGYDMGEVDQFLDEVEVELTRLHAQNDDLRSKLGDTSSPSADAPDGVVTSPVKAVAGSAPVAARVGTIGEASGAAARLLEIAAQNADQLVAEAQGDADRILGEATVKAERLDAESRAAAERLEAEAKTQSDSQAAELAQRRQDLLGALESDKEALSGELEELRSFEREYRSRLRAYFENQLRALDGEGGGDETPLSPVAGPGDDVPPPETESPPPGRLSELLSEDPPD